MIILISSIPVVVEMRELFLHTLPVETHLCLRHQLVNLMNPCQTMYLKPLSQIHLKLKLTLL